MPSSIVQAVVALGHSLRLSVIAEGVETTSAAVDLARKLNIDMPITEQMLAILENGKSPRQAIEDLMTRAARSENY